MQRYFVWVKSAKGPAWPQLWRDGVPRRAVKALADADPGDLVALHKLDEFESNTLDVLAVRYPAPIEVPANG